MHARNFNIFTNNLAVVNEQIARTEDPNLFKRGLPFPQCYERFPTSLPNPYNNSSEELSLATGMQYKNIDHAKRARRTKRAGGLKAAYKTKSETGVPRSLSMPEIGQENRKLMEDLRVAQVRLRSVDLSDPYADMSEARETLSSLRDSLNDVKKRRTHLRAGHPVRREPGGELTPQELHPGTRKSGLTHQMQVDWGGATNHSHPILGPRITSTYREGTGSGQAWFPQPDPDFGEFKPKKKPNDSCWWTRGEPSWKNINSTYRTGVGSGDPPVFKKHVSKGPVDSPLSCVPVSLGWFDGNLEDKYAARKKIMGH